MHHSLATNLRSSVILFAILLSGLFMLSCEEEKGCDEDQNGKYRGECAKYFSKFDKYKSDGATYESVTLSILAGADNATLFLHDTDGLIEKDIYTTASLSFSGSSLTHSFTVYISEVDRTNGHRMSGNFEWEGTFEENFQSFEVERTGSFTDVNF